MEVRQVQGYGRALFSSIDSAAGSLLVAEQPFVYAVDHPCISVICHMCWRKVPEGKQSLRRCSACFQAYYCNRLCQKAHWRNHRLECFVLKFYMKRMPINLPSLMMIFRIVIDRLTAIDSNGFIAFEQLINNFEKIPKERALEFVQMGMLVLEMVKRLNAVLENNFNYSSLSKQYIKLFQRIDKSFLNSLSVDKLARWFAALSCNGFTITDVELKPRELLFDCNCNRCLKQDTKENILDQQMSCVVCSACYAFIEQRLVEHNCQSCGASIPKHVKEAFAELPHILQQARGTKNFTDWKNLQQHLETIMQTITPFSHKNNSLMLQCYSTLIDFAVAEEDWATAEIHSEKVCTILEVVLPQGHPATALQHFLTAKLNWLLVHIESAIDNWSKALATLQITHGTEHYLVKAIKMSMLEAQHEIVNRTDCHSTSYKQKAYKQQL